MKTKRFLRIDDIGASTKTYEQYSRSHSLLNIGPLKHRSLFGSWGPYRELRPSDWIFILELLAQYKAHLNVAITAAWVEKDSTCTPFPDKYPEIVPLLIYGQSEGLITILNHGYTHCVVGSHTPHFLRGNRKFHREFWDYQPYHLHNYHISRSQQILTETFSCSPRIFVPPGNVYSTKTLAACASAGISAINTNSLLSSSTPLNFISNKSVIAFHDRELVLHGISWLEEILVKYPQGTFSSLNTLS